MDDGSSCSLEITSDWLSRAARFFECKNQESRIVFRFNKDFWQLDDIFLCWDVPNKID